MGADTPAFCLWKGSFLVFFVVSRQQAPVFRLLGAFRCQNCQVASREFLKILRSARQGDVFAQQELASIYLQGYFNTPIQPNNALVWLEKAYFVALDQNSSQTALSNSSQDALGGIFSQLVQVPLAATVGSPSFSFAWDRFWELAHDGVSEARWQLANLVLNPKQVDLQNQLATWLAKQASATDQDSTKLQTQCKGYLETLAAGESFLAAKAKDLLIQLQPKNELLTSLWANWQEDQDESALLQAAELGLTVAKLTLGLRLAQAKIPTAKNSGAAKSNAPLKKAVHWLELAGKDGDPQAWYALGEIYRRPQFSGYSANESDQCFDRAADLGHAKAQFRKAATLWRKRDKLNEKITGLQASYWAWQAHQQGIAEAHVLLMKIVVSCPNPAQNAWFDLAQYAELALAHHSDHQLTAAWVLMCHRIVIANQFNFSKAELLLAEIEQLQLEHCVAVDVRHELPKILPRLTQIESTSQRRCLFAASKAAEQLAIIREPSDDEFLAAGEGNLRQRRYRFERLCVWLTQTYGRNLAVKKSVSKSHGMQSHI